MRWTTREWLVKGFKYPTATPEDRRFKTEKAADRYADRQVALGYARPPIYAVTGKGRWVKRNRGQYVQAPNPPRRVRSNHHLRVGQSVRLGRGKLRGTVTQSLPGDVYWVCWGHGAEQMVEGERLVPVRRNAVKKHATRKRVTKWSAHKIVKTAQGRFEIPGAKKWFSSRVKAAAWIKRKLT